MGRRGGKGKRDWARGDCRIGGDWTGRDCIVMLLLTQVCALAGRVYLYFTKGVSIQSFFKVLS